MNTQNRLMALDIGKKRIGVAISDQLMMFASPHSSIPLTKDRFIAIKKILDVSKENNIYKIIIGYPINLAGEKTPQVVFTEKFTEKLKEFISKENLNIDVEYYDERLTSVQSERFLSHSGKKNTERREIKDKISASIILEAYIGSLKKKTL